MAWVIFMGFRGREPSGTVKSCGQRHNGDIKSHMDISLTAGEMQERREHWFFALAFNFDFRTAPLGCTESPQRADAVRPLPLLASTEQVRDLERTLF
jgi:hypothetical protein